MPSDRFFHILCTDGEKIRYEGRFQCSSRNVAYRLLREKVGKKNLYGLKYTITEFPIDVLREIIDSILNKRPLPEGDILKHKTIQSPPKQPPQVYANVKDMRYNPHKPTRSTVKRRLGDL